MRKILIKPELLKYRIFAEFAEDALIPVRKMSEYGACAEDIDVFTESVFANQIRLVNNAYAPAGQDEVKELYRQVM